MDNKKSNYNKNTYIGYLKLQNGGIKVIPGDRDNKIIGNRDKVLTHLTDVFSGGQKLKEKNIEKYFKALEGKYVRGKMNLPDTVKGGSEQIVKDAHKLIKLSLNKNLPIETVLNKFKGSGPKLYSKLESIIGSKIQSKNSSGGYESDFSYRSGLSGRSGGSRISGISRRSSGNRYSEGGNRYSEGGNRYSEGGNRYSEGGHRYSEGGNRYSEGGRRYSEGGRRYSEGGPQYSERGGAVSGVCMDRLNNWLEDFDNKSEGINIFFKRNVEPQCKLEDVNLHKKILETYHVDTNTIKRGGYHMDGGALELLREDLNQNHRNLFDIELNKLRDEISLIRR
jgi:hypothetical protein